MANGEPLGPANPAVDRVSGRETPGVREMRELAAARRRANPWETQGDESPSMDFSIPGRGLTPEGGYTPGFSGDTRRFQENLLPNTMGLIGTPGGDAMSKYDAKMAGQEMITSDWMNRQGVYGYHAGNLARPGTYDPVGREALASLAGLIDPKELARRRQAQMGGIATAQQDAQNQARAQYRMRNDLGLDPVQAAQMQQQNAIQAQMEMAKWEAEERTQQATIGTALAQEAGKWGTLEQERALGAANWGIGAWQGPLDLSLLSTPSTAEEKRMAFVGSPWAGTARGTSIADIYNKWGYRGPAEGGLGQQAVVNTANTYNNPFLR
tara:strand:- start:397 stop:1368 length:972 start_codon:yes stop_codon:yes gene_type:complete